MSEITYKIEWSLFLDGEEREHSTDEFTKTNFIKLFNFLNLNDDCMSYRLNTGPCMQFICNDLEAEYILTKRIRELANKKGTATALNSLYNSFEVKDIKVNGPATIVFWGDGTKTVVKCGPTETYDVEKAVAMCFMKKALGSRSMTKIFDLAEDRVAEYDNQFKRLEFTDIDTYLRNALSTFLNPNPGKLSDLKVQDTKESDSDHISAFKPEEEKE